MFLISVTIILTGVFFSMTARANEPSTNIVDSAQSQPAHDDAIHKDDAEQKKEAGIRFARGLEFYEEGDHALALIEFERAYQLVPDYRVLYNIAQVSIQLSRFARAHTVLTQFLKAGGEDVSTERRQAIEADLVMLEARTAQLRLKSALDGVQVLVDDLPAGVTPLDAPLVLDAGGHRVQFKKAGYLSQTQHLMLAGADLVDLEISLERVVIQKPTLVVQKKTSAPVQIKEPPPKVAHHRISPWLVAGWATTGALVGGSVVMGVLGLNSAKKADAIKDSPNPDRDDYNAHQSAAKNQYLAADILAVGAAIGFGTTLYFTLRHASRAPEHSGINSTRLGISPTQISFKGDFY